MQVHRKNAGGQVTPRTIEYIKKLINAVEAKSSVSHVDGKCSFFTVSVCYWNYFLKETLMNLKETSDGTIPVEQWNIPSGGYFIVDSF